MAYKNYRNMYNSIIRLSKKHFYETNLEKNKKNPKKNLEPA